MNWFRKIWDRTPSEYQNKFEAFRQHYPMAFKWVLQNRPHRLVVRTFQARDGRWRNQLVDDSPKLIGNRRTLGVTPGKGYGTKEEALKDAAYLRAMDDSRVTSRIFTDRNGRYRWRLLLVSGPDASRILQNTAGASFGTELEARQALGRVLHAYPKRQVIE